MREFILRTSKASTDYRFDISNLPVAGRMDIVCRCIINALFISESIRKDTVIHVVLNGPPRPPKIISFYGSRIKNLYPSERFIAEEVRKILRKGDNLKLDEEIEYRPGIKISNKTFETLIEEKVKIFQLVYFHKNGGGIDNLQLEKQIVAVISDYKTLPNKVENFLRNLKVEKVSLGKTEYLASQVINILNYMLDRRGF